MNPSKTVEDFFWAHLFRFSTFGPKEQAIVRKRLASECQQYVAAKLAEMSGQGGRGVDQLLSEAETKFKAMRDEVRAEAESKKWWQFWK